MENQHKTATAEIGGGGGDSSTVQVTWCGMWSNLQMKPNISITSHDALPPCQQHNTDKLLCKLIDSMQMKTEMTLIFITIDHFQCITRSWGGWRTTGTQCFKIFLPGNLSALAATLNNSKPL
jgi:hypothetical protein